MSRHTVSIRQETDGLNATEQRWALRVVVAGWLIMFALLALNVYSAMH